MPTTGITKCAVARQLTDTSSAMTYEKPQIFDLIQELDIKPKTNSTSAYAENRLIAQATLFDSAAITANWFDLTVQQRAMLLGQNVSAEGGTYAALGDVAPYVAVLYKSPLYGGKGNRYGVVYKGLFSIPDDTMKGLEGKPDLTQTPKLTGTFQSTEYFITVPDPNTGIPTAKHFWEYHIDTTEDLDDTWFNEVYIPEADTSPLTVTSNPANEATGIASSTNIVFTFNKSVNPSTVNANSVFLMKNDGTAIAATVTIDSTNTVVTVTPGTALAAAEYIAVITTDVTSLSGVSLANRQDVTFTVSAS